MSGQRSWRPGRRWFVLGLLLLAGALVISGAAFYLQATYRPTVGSGPAGPPVEQQAFQKPWLERPVLLVGLGDSITAGFGARPGYSYFARLIANPPEDPEGMRGITLSAVFPRLTATNLAISGSTSSAVSGGQLPMLPPQDARVFGVVVMTTGGNDLIHNYGRTPPKEEAMYGATYEQARPWIKNYEQRLEGIIAETRSRFPGGCHIFLANIYDPTDGAGDIEKAGLPAWKDGLKILAAYNDIILRCAERHPDVSLVDLRTPFLGHGIHSGQFWFKHYDPNDPHYWYYTNLEDPNERGYDAIRRLFLNAMSPVFTRPASGTGLPAARSALCFPSQHGMLAARCP